jgi:hypothetical protein
VDKALWKCIKRFYPGTFNLFLLQLLLDGKKKEAALCISHVEMVRPMWLRSNKSCCSPC